jgi:hypothetical protein
MNRRELLGAFAALGFTGCAKRVTAPAPGLLPAYDAVPKIYPIRAHTDRIFRTTGLLCGHFARRVRGMEIGKKWAIRPSSITTAMAAVGGGRFRGAPGSLVVEKALATGSREIAVVGCGAIGLTSAILLQRAGFRDDDLCEGASTRRFIVFACKRGHGRRILGWRWRNRLLQGFPALWEKMTRYSFHMSIELSWHGGQSGGVDGSV